jgi:phosphoglycolate phosphatase-like HAD superfamily hydrolase
MKYKYLVFDFSNTLVKMRPAKLLLPKSKLRRLSQFYKLAIVTGAKKTEVVNILTKLKIKRLFRTIITKDDTSLRKPDPKLFKLIIDSTCVILYIGDSPNDAKMAKEANINFLNVKDFKNI